MIKYLILAFFIPLFSLGQSNLKVTYKSSISINLDTLKGPLNFKKSFEKAINKSELLDFNLSINSKDNISVFNRNDLVDSSISKLDLNIISLIIEADGKYFTSKGKLIHDYYLIDKNLKVEIEDKINWSLVNEKKSIGNYECLKAIGKVHYGKHKGETIEAWYAPSIPLSFGPKMYYGLPGLILEIKEKNNVLYADKIEFLNKDIRIRTPKKDQLISEKKADSILAIMNKKAIDYFKN
ncbi:GLPGLI family protein [Winogradskyella pacifica]|uniref:GLPGLI family protein n=1 Tax=Winogradskyella pacifica TaxID=664642 RepID=A0A3D9N6M2_9FLAO|nr:GLPGLI family protein [Winogradskyella pacifica]REE27803.1 GLPGLI family protein [Winogradskyella pacifica]